MRDCVSDVEDFSFHVEVEVKEVSLFILNFVVTKQIKLHTSIHRILFGYVITVLTLSLSQVSNRTDSHMDSSRKSIDWP